MSCPYPSHFELYNEPDTFVLYSLEAPDKTAAIKICGTNNRAGLSSETVRDNFIDSYPGRVESQTVHSDSCEVTTLDGDVYHYGYFVLSGGMIRGFEFHFNGEHYSTYKSYINSIKGAIKFD